MNSAGVLGSFGASVISDTFQKTVIEAVMHPSVAAFFLRQAAKATGFAASKAEYAGRSLRRQEMALYERAERVERAGKFVKNPAPEVGLIGMIRECWRD